MVGVAGFEPTTPCSQSRCANRTALHPEIFKRHKGTHYISICNPIAPRKTPRGRWYKREVTRVGFKPTTFRTGIWRSIQLSYRALLPLCALQRYIFLPNRLIPLCSRIETIAPICLLYEKKKSSLTPPKVGGDGSSLFCGATHSLLWIRFCVDNLAPCLSSWMGARVDVIICVNSLFRQYTSFLVS